MSKALIADTTGSGFHLIHWFTKTPGASLEYNTGLATPTLTPNTQFDDVMRNYTFYKPYGLKIKFIPRMFGQNTNNQSTLIRFHWASYCSNTLGSPDDTDLLNAKDFKAYQPAGPVQRFYRLGKYLKGVKWSWIKEGYELDEELKMKTAIKVWGENY